MNYQEKSIKKWLQLLYADIILEPLDCIKVSIPSLTYVLQNNLLYIAVSNLDAATFQARVYKYFFFFLESVNFSLLDFCPVRALT